MSGKVGSKHANPRDRIYRPYEYPGGADIADPAKGARVPRCRACGLPNPLDVVGVRNGQHGRFPICDRCWMDVNGPSPMDTDPLTVEEEAA